jgi:signal transduction histidine kinase
VSRLPIRARLTLAFALAMVLVLAGAGLYAYVRLRSNLDQTLNAGLRARAAAVAAQADRPSALAAAPGEESFAQVVAPDGRVLAATGGTLRPVLGPAELRRARSDELVVERPVPGIEDTARVLAVPASGRRGARVVVVGQSLEDRDEALSSVATSFAVGGALATVLAALVGYALATAGLAPVEAMRRRAAEVSLNRGEERLPLPAAHDEVRRLGETLNDMLGRLRRSFERERRFVADASHELRTPIAVIKTELEGALRTGDYGEDVRDALVAAIEECDHLAQLAEDLLVLARAADGQLPVRREDLWARAVLEGVHDRFADRATQHGRRIHVDAPPNLGFSADPLRLRQALGNLVDNALRHGHGEVVLRARRSAAWVEIDVSDRGPGFSPEVAERAFERFTRGDAARTRSGAGLGLAIVQAIAEAHGGSATIVPGKGATVRIRLPEARPAAAGEPAAEGAGSSQRRLRWAPYGGARPSSKDREETA